jgi:protein O-GlcNAc transferase
MKQRNTFAVRWPYATIALKPDHAEAYANRGNVLNVLKQHETAVVSFSQAIALRHDYAFVHGTRLHTRMKICDWRGVEHQIAELIQKIERHEKATPSFPVLALSASAPLQRQAAEICWVATRR